MWLLLFGWLLVLIGIILLIIGALKDEEGWTFGGALLTIIFGLVMITTTIFVPLGLQGELQEMKAFNEANAQNYQVATTKTQLILSERQFIDKALIPIEGSIEKFKLADSVAARLQEWRDEVVLYNVRLAKFQYFNKHPVVGFYYPDPGDLKFILIK